jgi:hypothetical protein
MPSTVWTAPASNYGWAVGPTANTAALVDASPGPDPCYIPAFANRGAKVSITALGSYVTASAPTATVVFGLYLGVPNAVIAGAVKLAESSAITVVNTATVSWPWKLEWDGTIETLTSGTGTLGTIFGFGTVKTPTSLTATAETWLPITAALRTVSFDTSVTRQLMLGITLSATTGGPAMTCQHLSPLVSGG